MALDSRGQIEGIGSAPRFSAKAGGRAASRDVDLTAVHDCRSALQSLSVWLAPEYGRARVLASGIGSCMAVRTWRAGDRHASGPR
jgi:hypothetical protein